MRQLLHQLVSNQRTAGGSFENVQTDKSGEQFLVLKKVRLCLGFHGLVSHVIVIQ